MHVMLQRIPTYGLSSFPIINCPSNGITSRGDEVIQLTKKLHHGHEKRKSTVIRRNLKRYLTAKNLRASIYAYPHHDSSCTISVRLHLNTKRYYSNQKLDRVSKLNIRRARYPYHLREKAKSCNSQEMLNDTVNAGQAQILDSVAFRRDI